MAQVPIAPQAGTRFVDHIDAGVRRVGPALMRVGPGCRQVESRTEVVQASEPGSKSDMSAPAPDPTLSAHREPIMAMQRRAALLISMLGRTLAAPTRR